jgi:phenylacetate-coenzyme A ligase PaaK-like adenylate-forming protein
MDLSDIREEGRGRLIFTNLARKSSPFVRYLLDDDVTIERFNGDQSKGKCREEYAFSIVPHGRSELGVYTSKGLFGIGHFEEELFRSGLFADYTITVNDADDMDVAGINGFDQEHILVRAETYHDGDAVGDLQIKMVRQIEKNFEVKFGLKTRCELMPMGTLFDYRAVRESKPLWRLRDERATHTQRYPVHV